jgi:hypothetical protein
MRPPARLTCWITAVAVVDAELDVVEAATVSSIVAVETSPGTFVPRPVW